MEKTLRKTLLEVRDRILINLPDLAASEERVRQLLIDPVLEALGWDFASGSVLTEYPLPTGSRGKNPVLDYVLMEKLPWGAIPRIAIEAKRMDGEVLPLRNPSSFKDALSGPLASIREVICQEGISAIPRGGKHFPESVIITDGDIWEIYKILTGTSEPCPDGFELVKVECKNKNNEDDKQPASSNHSQPDVNEPVQEAAEASNTIQQQDQQIASQSGKTGKSTAKLICKKLLKRVQLTRDSLVNVAQILESYIAPEAVGHWGSGSASSRLTLKQAYINRGSLPSTKGPGPSVDLYIRLADAASLQKAKITWDKLPGELLQLIESSFGIKIAPFLASTGFSVKTGSVSPLSTTVHSKPPHTALSGLVTKCLGCLQ